MECAITKCPIEIESLRELKDIKSKIQVKSIPSTFRHEIFGELVDLQDQWIVETLKADSNQVYTIIKTLLKDIHKHLHKDACLHC